MRPAGQNVFSYMTLGDLRHFGNNDSMGQNAGCLGRAYDPFTVPFVRPTTGALDMGHITSVFAELDGRQLAGRRDLRERLAPLGPADKVFGILKGVVDSGAFVKGT